MNVDLFTQYRFFKIIFAFAMLLVSNTLSAQQNSGFEPLFTSPLSYVVNYTANKLTIDGNLNEAAWQKAQWTTTFTDIEGDAKPKPTYNTKVKMLWNNDYLFIAAQLQEPQIWANQKHYDDIIFHDNDFEVFIDPHNTTHQYFEIEVNAINQIFDLFMSKPYRSYGNALIGWNADGLKSAVKVNGTLNKPTDIDKSWTVEMAIPLRSIWINYPFKAPVEGTLWRINFSRVEWDTKAVKGKTIKLTDASGHNLPEHNWVWSPIGVVNMHYPERWGYLQFTKTDTAQFILPYSEKQKKALWLIYYKQAQYLNQHKKYAATLADLNIEPVVTIDNQINYLTMETTNHQFKAWINLSTGSGISINNEGLIQYQDKQ